jgi:hypothetical protein
MASCLFLNLILITYSKALRSLSYSVAFLWNNLPESLRLSQSLTRLKVVWNHYIQDEPTPTRQPGRTVLFPFISSFLSHSLYLFLYLQLVNTCSNSFDALY